MRTIESLTHMIESLMHMRDAMQPVAAIDIGSNSVRLLIIDGSRARREVVVTRLGAGAAVGEGLRADAVERTAAALREFGAAVQGAGLADLRVTATAAVRDASNRHEVVSLLSDAIGAPVVVIDGATEARLAFAGATHGLGVRRNEWNEPALDVVVDIGGGSTEFTIGHPGAEPLGSWSVPVGCVRITDAWLHGDPPTAMELSQAISVIDAHLDDVDRELPMIRSADRMIGVAGSIVTVAALELGRYDRDVIHRMQLTKAAAEDVFRTVATESADDRAFNPGLHPDRVTTIVGGSAILVAVLRHYGLDGCLVSESDSLDAVASLPAAVWRDLAGAAGM
jgi:exopolyphosphatase / guanosine-5'-triphosphate,3'-diphosphate pyrophosphatase